MYRVFFFISFLLFMMYHQILEREKEQSRIDKSAITNRESMNLYYILYRERRTRVICTSIIYYIHIYTYRKVCEIPNFDR